MAAMRNNKAIRVYCNKSTPTETVHIILNKLKEIQQDKSERVYNETIATLTDKLDFITQDDYDTFCESKLHMSTKAPSMSLSVLNNNISFTKLIKVDDGMQAAKDELNQVCDENVWEPVHIQDIPSENRNIYPSHVFGKIKTSVDGQQKYKARIVFDGSKQPPPQFAYLNTSPTADIISVMTLLAIAAATDAKIFAMDVKGAFLKVARKADDKPIFMRISPEVAEVLMTIRPDYKPFKNNNGTIYVKIKKAIYGMVESPRLFYDDLVYNLKENGFVRLNADKCIFKKEDENGTTFLAIWVDDILGITVKGNDSHRDTLMDALTKRYGKATIQTAIRPGEKIKYLNMTVTKESQGTIRLDQKEYIEKLLSDNNIHGYSKYPASQNLFEEKEDAQPLSVKDAEIFQSQVMALLYVALRTRPDILCAILYLSTRVSKSTENDKGKLLKVFQYLRYTKSLGRVFNPDNLNVSAMIDASYAIYSDAKGQSGIILSLGMKGGMIYITARKQKLVAKSSTEAELIALNDGSSRILWLKELMTELGYNQGPTKVYQDNKSTIYLAESGEGKLGKTKHIQVRYFYIKQLIDNHDIYLEHKTTNNMTADILTKPLLGDKFITFRNEILNEIMKQNQILEGVSKSTTR